MVRQNETTLSRETKKQVLRAHMDYVRDRLIICECLYRTHQFESYLQNVRRLYDLNSYLASIGIFNLVKYHLLNEIIDNYLRQSCEEGRCTA